MAGEHDRERLVLTVCLREIERSRPFLVGLLGDRYGWAPPADRIGDAAREAGLDGDLAGTSVTELEILHGVLHRPDQQRRSWFYLRDPLPYDTMPPDVAARYSDAHGGEAHATDRVRRLEHLKTRLREALPGRVRSYHAAWDAGTGQVRGLEAWGAQVLADLWSDLERETDEMVARTPRTWQEQDRQAFEAFVESRVRGFVGRSAVTRDLLAFATSGVDGGPWATCVTTEAGGGKSSLLGHLHRELRQRPDVLVLAHAAGISVRSTDIDRMLGRWVTELAEALGESDPLPDGASSAEVTTTFGRWLHRAAGTRRVVVLVDALDQFGSTIPATYLTWLPAPWPADARLIAAATPGAQSRALLERPGTFETRLPPIDREDAAALIRQLCGRYHRTVNPRVEEALLDARRDGGAPAWGNPLWLELAVEEINLLGADAFERADGAFPDVAGGRRAGPRRVAA